ncbi:succinate dehydrogenase cytochrome b558 subunit [Pullulanibacillus camelliae]|uniref:Succinate dehydrogenase cytochrome b558 subunit n=1 Tax=Pullulanibacillus camelliae TaxID=1707096 RepID=A0A8J2YHA6_9BACL|nr:succinate dehydrogenase cytochrome b558 subunit [Pullulanibacillus camelliae]GGE42400.1 succinate dehydrogenase cytochrome b558 subunit [Pullulanibacillus camelliae]
MASRDFVNRRLHSFLGLIPIGLFLVVHLTVNYFATRGAEAFDKAANFMEKLPYLVVLEIVFIYLPLLFHAIYGIYIAFQAKPNVKRFGYYRNWLFFFQRWTGLFLVIFLAWHIWETRIAMLRGTELNFEMMANILDNPWMVAFYIVGVLCAVYHFSNGLWAFLVHWGIIVTPKSQRYTSYLTVIIFILLAIVGIRSVFAFVNPDTVAMM